MKLRLAKGKFLLNPGSVGQPRDRNCGASWMLLNSNNMDFKIFKTKYSHKRIISQIKKYDKNNPKILKYFKKCN